MFKFRLIVIILSTACFPAKSLSAGICLNDTTENANTVKLNPQAFSKVIGGKQVGLYFLKNKKGTVAAITNYGARVVSLRLATKKSGTVDVVLGFDSLQQFMVPRAPFYGAVVGRYGNRIAKGRITVDGKTYQLPLNNGFNTLHGGKKGFHSVVWQARQINDHQLELTYISKDGDEGFPGNLTATIVYSLTDDNGLKLAYEAKTDQTTVVNLTNHTYFNLNGISGGTILNHTLQINADHYTPVDSTSIPTGDIAPVKNTPFDFTTSHSIGQMIEVENRQLAFGKGYDHNFALNNNMVKDGLSWAATVIGDKTGVVMKIYSAEPGLQFYSGNFMNGKNVMRGNVRDAYRTGFCLETQHYPDAPNHPNFQSTMLKPGQVYKSTTIYNFSTR